MDKKEVVRKAVKDISNYIAVLENQRLVSLYEDEINSIEVFKELDSEQVKYMGLIYAKARQEGSSIEHSRSISKSIFDREYGKRFNRFEIIKSLEDVTNQIYSRVVGKDKEGLQVNNYA